MGVSMNYCMVCGALIETDDSICQECADELEDNADDYRGDILNEGWS